MSNWLTVGCINGALAVATGAFGAHGLKARIQDKQLLDIWSTASHYHLIHSIAICLSSIVLPNNRGNRSAQLFTAGITIFRNLHFN